MFEDVTMPGFVLALLMLGPSAITMLMKESKLKTFWELGHAGGFAALVVAGLSHYVIK